MIRISTLLFFSLFAISAFAADRPKGGSLVISTYDNSALRVTIDGRSYNDRDNYFAISNIDQGYHSVQVFRASTSRSPFDIFGRNREQLVFNQSVYIKKNTEVAITINRNGRAQIDERKMNGNGRNDRNYKDYNDRDDRNDRDRDKDWDRNGGYGNGGYGNNGGYDNNRSVSFIELAQMKETLRRERSENSRMGMARQMFDANLFKAEQVKDLLLMFSSESYKLDLAKYAYRNTIDRNNYSVVNDVFSYSSSKQELSRFIAQYR